VDDLDYIRGQSAAVTALRAIIKSENPGGVLLLGPHGTGKTKAVIALNNALNSIAYDEFSERIETRELVAMLDAGQNVFLTSSDTEKVPPAILTRCLVVRFQPLSVDALVNILLAQTVQVSMDAIVYIAQQANGNARLALKMLQQLVLENEKASLERAQELWPDTSLFGAEFFALAQSGDVSKANDIIRSTYRLFGSVKPLWHAIAETLRTKVTDNVNTEDSTRLVKLISKLWEFAAIDDDDPLVVEGFWFNCFEVLRGGQTMRARLPVKQVDNSGIELLRDVS
jgi:DNA polymerase III gamma/tau subunit